MPPKKAVPTESAIQANEYAEFLGQVKQRIQAAQTRASLAVNGELLALYWDIGREIVERQQRDGWGSSVIDRLAADLQKAYPGIKGFSTRNVSRMRAFYLAFVQLAADSPNLPQAVAKIPWGHYSLLLEKLKDPIARQWYAVQAMANGWSRAVLWHHIDTKLYERQGLAEKSSNFMQTLPPPQSDLAQEFLKDPYSFDFLTLGEDAHERDLERGLIDHIRQFLLELGVGFAFVGSQYHLTIGSQDFYIDLLFYHYRLRCFVVIELKMTEFKPEHAGKMNFYLSAVDDLLRHPDDQPTIGIILCKSKDKVVVEYALRDTHKPIGVSNFQLAEALPEDLKGSLPTIEDLEAELAGPHEAE